MRARTRDVIVVCVFALGAILVRLAWHPLGAWVSLVIAFLSVLAAVAVYQVRRRAGPHPTEPPVASHPPVTTVSRRRRA